MNPSASPPLISIVIPTYNRETLLPRAISSIVAQSHPAWELVVVDDGSTDRTEEVVRKFGDPRIRYVKQENAGRSNARNHGVRIATAEYVTFLDSDDASYPDWLSRFLAVIAEQGRPDIVSCGVDWSHADGTVYTTQLPKKLDAVYGGFRMLIRSGTYCIRRDRFLGLEGYAPGLEICEHTELAFRIGQAAEREGWKFANVAQPLVQVYGMNTTIANDPQGTVDAIELLLTRHSQALKVNPPKVAQLLSIAGVNSARANRPANARRYFFRAWRTRPFVPKHVLRFMVSCLPGVPQRIWRPQATGQAGDS